MPRDDTGLPSHGVPVHRETALGDDELAHAARVRARLIEAVDRSTGWISFERYMEIALYAPGLGYYSAGAHKLGAAGDFTTAPEISPLFGRCLARQCADALLELGEASILEIGAGSGRMAVDILEGLEHEGVMPRRYLILEPSADLRERQQRLIGEAVPPGRVRVEWLDAPPAAGFDGIVLANEVLDSLPVRRFRQEAGGFRELGVAVESGRFIWSARPADAELEARCRLLAAAGGGWEDGYESECCPRLAAWTAHVTRSLRRGLVLWIDYGLSRRAYYLPERCTGTLLCHFRHHAHDDPFHLPGLEDITAWVDFTALAEAADAAGFDVAGFTTQAHFLAALGIAADLQASGGVDDPARSRRAAEARRLLLPGEMGERFKVMAWSRNLSTALRGFGVRDLRHTL